VAALLGIGHSVNGADRNGTCQELRFRRESMYSPDDCHPLPDETKRGGALPIRKSPASEIELRLVADADKEATIRLARPETPHRYDAVAMFQT
jgi:hypothetical protein